MHSLSCYFKTQINKNAKSALKIPALCKFVFGSAYIKIFKIKHTNEKHISNNKSVLAVEKGSSSTWLRKCNAWLDLEWSWFVFLSLFIIGSNEAYSHFIQWCLLTFYGLIIVFRIHLLQQTKRADRLICNYWKQT